MDLDFSEDEIARYARHILLDEVGGLGQAKLRAARVLIAGAGGLGSPLALYLAAAGIGTIGIADPDHVDLSNLQRQIAHTASRVGQPKALSAAQAMAEINPAVHIRTHALRIDAANVADVIADYDIVCDGTDNFDARYVLADACYKASKTLVSAAVLRFEGQLSTFRCGHAANGETYPCHGHAAGDRGAERDSGHRRKPGRPAAALGRPCNALPGGAPGTRSSLRTLRRYDMTNEGLIEWPSRVRRREHWVYC